MAVHRTICRTMSSQSALLCHGSVFGLLNRTHWWSHVTEWPHMAVEHFLLQVPQHGTVLLSHQRPDNQRCLLPTALKDSSICTTASAPQCLARARFYEYALYKFTLHYITQAAITRQWLLVSVSHVAGTRLAHTDRRQSQLVQPGPLSIAVNCLCPGIPAYFQQTDVVQFCKACSNNCFRFFVIASIL